MIERIMGYGMLTLGVGLAGIVYHKNKRWIDHTFSTNCRKMRELSQRLIEGKPNYPDKLLLYFDINKTLTRKDGTKKGVDERPLNGYQMISLALAESTIYKWDGVNEISYKDYIYQQIPGNKEEVSVKNQRLTLLLDFPQWLVRQNHPKKDDVLKELDRMINTYQNPDSKELKFTVYRSFYKLLEKLREQKIPFNVILCTFGGDLVETYKEIEANRQGVLFSRVGKFEKGKLHLNEGKIIERIEDIFQTFNQSEEHFALLNNRKEWVEDQERSESAKPFIYDSECFSQRFRCLSLFFDDNLTFEEKDIVSPRNISSHKYQTKDLKDRLLFQVDPREAEVNDKYYINLTSKAFQSQGYASLR